MIDQHRHIALARAQRRQGDDFKAQPVEEIGAEAPGIGGGGQIVIGRSDNADIDPQRL